MEDERLSYLVSAYLDRSLTPVEKRELDGVLLESEAARRQFWEQASLHGLSYNAAKQHFAAAPETGAAPADEFAPVPAQRPPTRARGETGALARAWPWLRRWPVALALGGGGALALAAWLHFHPGLPTRYRPAEIGRAYPAHLNADAGEDSPTVAVVLRTSSIAQDNASLAFEVGSPLVPGQLELRSGLLELGFLKGARLVVQGPAKLDLISRQEVYLHYGRISAVVPEQARGFRVNAAEVQLTDLGTEFGMYKPLDQPAEVHVFQGKVIVSSRATGRQERELTQGRGVVCAPDQVRDIHADRAAFVSEDELARRQTQELRTRYTAWKTSTAHLDDDPATLLHYTFEDQQASDLEVKNRVRSPAPESQGSLIGCSWSEGRWPDKAALEFRRQSDRVRLAVPGAFESLTYLAWVRVDSLPNQLNALALTESVQPGEVHWQINAEGRLWLAVRWHAGGGDPNWEVSTSPPAITPERFGRWLLLASVYDGQTRMIHHYLNGQCLSSQTIQHPATLVLGAVEVGNWGARAEKPQFAAISNIGDDRYRTRNFVGRMDEFALFCRALSPVEIQRLYEQGQPAALGRNLGLAWASERP